MALGRFHASCRSSPTPAARRLAEKNRLGDLAIEGEARATRRQRHESRCRASQPALSAAAAAESAARQAHKGAFREIETAREDNAAAEKHKAETAARLSAIEEALLRLNATCDEASEKHAQAKAALAQLDAPSELTARLDMARATAAHDRAAVAEASAELQAHLRDARRAQSVCAASRKSANPGMPAAIARAAKSARWKRGARKPRKSCEDLLRRRICSGRPSNSMRQIEAAEEARKRAADNRAEAESRLAGADRAARDALAAMSAAREEKARSEARVEAARARCGEIAHMIAAELDCTEAELFGLAHVAPGDGLPPMEEVEKRLDGLKDERERLGGVNLRAEEELNEILTSKTNLSTEHADLTEAIRRLRLAIQSLNKEGRERLLSAFDAVHTHFKELFTTLFGGGSAELQLIESDDPLEAGLEIVVWPPGKKPQVMTLLSGGEQALTAMALIFAIFLTNPAPVCVLDEVDAPLDDANVERFCNFLDNMRGKTETRFITVTHNPITMAQMNRLFGVTIVERGVSQLVSVDLEEAERFRDAG